MKRRNVKEEDETPPNIKSHPPIRNVAAKYPESRLSDALFNLSVKDRTAIEEEMHGVSCMAPEETPQMLEDSLEEFHLELSKIEQKPAYDLAQEQLQENPSGQPSSYIHAKGYKLRFLRSELFDACKAAKRYCNYLDMLLNLYGNIALKRPIRLKDLTREETSFLRKGRTQALPCRDRSGRRIICIVANSREKISRETLLKVYIYIFATLLGGDEIINNDLDQLETQRKGTIVIFMPSFQHVIENLQDFNYLRLRAQTVKITVDLVPVRLVTAHICLPKIPWIKTVSSIVERISSNVLPRTKMHFGNHTELRYQLQGYGIPSELIPSTDTGNIKTANFKQWIKMRTYLESQTQITEGEILSGDESITSLQSFPPITQIVECPGSNDVIFRRGKAMNHHPGNAKFLNLIEQRIYEHTIDPQTLPTRRTAIEIELIEKVRQEGGRFLKWEIDKGWLVDMSTGTDKEIQNKVHYAFRDFRKKMLRVEQKPISNPSSTYAFAHQDGQKRKRYSNSFDESNNDCNMGDGCA